MAESEEEAFDDDFEDEEVVEVSQQSDTQEKSQSRSNEKDDSGQNNSSHSQDNNENSQNQSHNSQVSNNNSNKSNEDGQSQSQESKERDEQSYSQDEHEESHNSQSHSNNHSHSHSQGKEKDEEEEEDRSGSYSHDKDQHEESQNSSSHHSNSQDQKDQKDESQNSSENSQNSQHSQNQSRSMDNKGESLSQSQPGQEEEEKEEEGPIAPVLVTIIGAAGLRDADEGEGSDPYCTCEVQGYPGTRISTDPVENSMDLVWNWEGELKGFFLGDSLLFQVWDKDQKGEDEILGHAVLPAGQLEEAARTGDVYRTELQLGGVGAGSDNPVLGIKVFVPANLPTRPAVASIGAAAAALKEEKTEEKQEGEGEQKKENEEEKKEEKKEEEEDESYKDESFEEEETTKKEESQEPGQQDHKGKGEATDKEDEEEEDNYDDEDFAAADDEGDASATADKIKPPPAERTRSRSSSSRSGSSRSRSRSRSSSRGSSRSSRSNKSDSRSNNLSHGAAKSDEPPSMPAVPMNTQFSGSPVKICFLGGVVPGVDNVIWTCQVKNAAASSTEAWPLDSRVGVGMLWSDPVEIQGAHLGDSLIVSLWDSDQDPDRYEDPFATVEISAADLANASQGEGKFEHQANIDGFPDAELSVSLEVPLLQRRRRRSSGNISFAAEEVAKLESLAAAAGAANSQTKVSEGSGMAPRISGSTISIQFLGGTVPDVENVLWRCFVGSFPASSPRRLESIDEPSEKWDDVVGVQGVHMGDCMKICFWDEDEDPDCAKDPFATVEVPAAELIDASQGEGKLEFRTEIGDQQDSEFLIQLEVPILQRRRRRSSGNISFGAEEVAKLEASASKATKEKDKKPSGADMDPRLSGSAITIAFLGGVIPGVENVIWTCQVGTLAASVSDAFPLDARAGISMRWSEVVEILGAHMGDCMTVSFWDADEDPDRYDDPFATIEIPAAALAEASQGPGTLEHRSEIEGFPDSEIFVSLEVPILQRRRRRSSGNISFGAEEVAKLESLANSRRNSQTEEGDPAAKNEDDSASDSSGSSSKQEEGEEDKEEAEPPMDTGDAAMQDQTSLPAQTFSSQDSQGMERVHSKAKSSVSFTDELPPPGEEFDEQEDQNRHHHEGGHRPGLGWRRPSVASTPRGSHENLEDIMATVEEEEEESATQETPCQPESSRPGEQAQVIVVEDELDDPDYGKVKEPEHVEPEQDSDAELEEFLLAGKQMQGPPALSLRKTSSSPQLRATRRHPVKIAKQGPSSKFDRKAQKWDDRFHLLNDGGDNSQKPRALRTYFSRPASLPALRNELMQAGKEAEARRLEGVGKEEERIARPSGPISADAETPVIPGRYRIGGLPANPDGTAALPWNDRWSRGVALYNEFLHPLHRAGFSRRSVFEVSPSQKWRRFNHMEVATGVWRRTHENNPRFPPLGV